MFPIAVHQPIASGVCRATWLWREQRQEQSRRKPECPEPGAQSTKREWKALSRAVMSSQIFTGLLWPAIWPMISVPEFDWQTCTSCVTPAPCTWAHLPLCPVPSHSDLQGMGWFPWGVWKCSFLVKQPKWYAFSVWPSLCSGINTQLMTAGSVSTTEWISKMFLTVEFYAATRTSSDL